MLSRRKLESQVSFARAESRRLEHDVKKLAAQQQSHNCATQQATHAFVPAEALAASRAGATGRVLLCVGGQRFECTRTLLCRDPGSLLAALCAVGAPLGGEQGKDEPERGGGASEGCGRAGADGEADRRGTQEEQGVEERPTACFERDWWLFRYVLDFLRDGILPSSPQLVWRLYEEASFWQLASLQRAVEQRHAGLFRRAAGVRGGDGSDVPLQPGQLSAAEHQAFVAAAQRAQGIVPSSDGSLAANKCDKPALPTDGDWWAKAPQWWGEKPKAKPKPKPNPKWDWWTTQKGRGGQDFTTLSDWKHAPDVKTPKEKDARKKLVAAEKAAMLHTSFADVGRGMGGGHSGGYGSGGGASGFAEMY